MKILSFDAVVIGSGAAGFSAACRLKEAGKEVCIVTESILCGTSRNTGSDKQTYYKLGLGGSERDSVRQMAKDLFSGGCVDGDNALCEAALSARCFLSLCEMGVPFPTNRYGEYIGYKTDHDPYARATSAGPLTSKFMTEALEKKARALSIPILDSTLAVKLLKHDGRLCGVLCIHTEEGEYFAIRCGDLVLATGGPAGIFADSVYPEGQTGASSLALEAGAEGQNLAEWQFGLASASPRWNVSGSYMQVLPRFVSVDENGVEREFLSEYFSDPYKALSMIFLKGYQWPFDSKKIPGSSVIDLLVYREQVMRGRRVYLDFTRNPFGLAEIDYEKLSPEAYEYLKKASVLFGTPIQRLSAMNLPAVNLYREKGVKIDTDYLEIALCAQHHNGGIAVDLWWQTSIPGLFAVGECAGTHGVTRPGGSALNAGQVGALRAANFIASRPASLLKEDLFHSLAEGAGKKEEERTRALLGEKENVTDLIDEARRRMSNTAGAIRDTENMKATLQKTRALLSSLSRRVTVKNISSRFFYYKLKDLLVVQEAVLLSMIDHGDGGFGSRGSALYYDKSGKLCDGLEECFRFCEEKEEARRTVQTVSLSEEGFVVARRTVRPLPDGEDFFENIWKSYRQNKNIF